MKRIRLLILAGLSGWLMACSSSAPESDAGSGDDGAVVDSADSGDQPGDQGDYGQDSGNDDGLSGDDGYDVDDGDEVDDGDDGGGGLDDYPADAGDAGGDPGDQVTDDGPDLCNPYPLQFQPHPDSQALAEAALSDLAPTGILGWSTARGTLEILTGLNLPLTQCGDTQDIFPILLSISSQAPDLFQLDPGEWGEPQPFECRHVGESNRILPLARLFLGGSPVNRDVFSFIVKREGAVVELKSVTGNYLPPAPDELVQAMNSCPSLDEIAAEEVIRNYKEFDYIVMEYCNPIGSGTYLPAQNDTVEFDPVSDHRWTWHDNSTQNGMLLSKQRSGRLVIHPDNYTNELLSSNAACPLYDDLIVGFEFHFDSVTGELLSVSAGIGCIVC